MRPRITGRMAGIALSAALCSAASAQTVLTATSSTNYTTNGAANVVVDNALSLTGSTSITKVTVSISSGFQSGDLLAVSSLPSGVTSSYNSTSGVLTLTGSATHADYQTALRTVAISLSSSSSVTRSVTFAAGDLLAFTNGHYYKYVTTAQSWTSAKADAALAANKYYGLTGYLATIGSDAENTFIQQKLSADAWIGASDGYLQINAATGVTTFADQTASEGKWYWVTGPEKGTKFYQVGNTPPTVSGQYAKWNSGEPNNYNTGEEYAEIFSSGAVAGAWNDLNNSNNLGYVVEFGGMPGDPAVQLSGSRNVTIQATSITGTYNSGSYNLNGSAKVVDNTLSLYASGNITDARATISTGKQTGDVLGYSSGSLPSGVTGSYNSTTGVLSFTGSATAAAWQSLLRTVTFAASTGSGTNRTVTFSLGSNIAGSNGHFYQYVSSTGISWATAKTNAAGLNYYGLTGYLATITTADENTFITQKLSSDGWIGATDEFSLINANTSPSAGFADQNASEGKWYWVTGPEKGTQFSQTNINPVSVNSQYMNWNTNEPNNSGTGEHYAQIYASAGNLGKWNDLNGTSQNGYVVEYGGLSSDPAVTLASSSMITVATPLPIQGMALSATARQQSVALAWEVLNEKDVRSYVVERSGNGLDFKAIGELPSVGNGNHRYESMDRQPLAGTGYYRIRSADADGSAAYSPVVSVHMTADGATLRIYPNPASTLLQIERDEASAAGAVVTDLSGNRLLQATLTGYTTCLDIRSLPAGTYFLQLSGVQQKSIRFTKF